MLINSSTYPSKDLNIPSYTNKPILPFLFTFIPIEDSYMYVGVDSKKTFQVKLLKGEEQSFEFDSLIQFDIIGASIKKVFLNIHDISKSIDSHQDLIRGSYDIPSQKLFISLYR